MYGYTTTTLPKRVINKKNLVLMSDYVIYTDGGCCNTSVYGEGGSAYVILQDGKIFAQNSKGFVNTTNNIMELLAIASAVNALPKGSSALIHSDSQYAIKVLCGQWKAKTNQKQISLFRDIVKSKELEISFKWVRGHNGDYYNEMVDSMCTSEIENIVSKYNLPKNRFTKKKISQQPQLCFT
jgi:ribonuclease HI